RSNTLDPIEQIGMEKSSNASESAELVLFVVDVQEGLLEEGEKLLTSIRGKEKWLVWNKIDLGRPRENLEHLVGRSFEVSALRGEGIDQLLEEIGKYAEESTEIVSEGGVANDRQRELLGGYLESMTRAEEEWSKGVSPEFVAVELRDAHRK